MLLCGKVTENNFSIGEEMVGGKREWEKEGDEKQKQKASNHTKCYELIIKAISYICLSLLSSWSHYDIRDSRILSKENKNTAITAISLIRKNSLFYAFRIMSNDEWAKNNRFQISRKEVETSPPTHHGSIYFFSFKNEQKIYLFCKIGWAHRKEEW